MEIEDSSGLNFRLDEKNHVASVIKSPKATGSIIIPRFIENNGNKYKIMSIADDAFTQNKIDSITFPPDSEVISFKKDAFLQTSIKKLQIPSSLKTIDGGCFYLVTDLVDIEVSPDNHLFSYIGNKYLVSKSDAKSDIFDILIYARFDIEEAEIPPFIKVIKRHSFNVHLKSLTFPEDTRIESIEFGNINKSFKKLIIPPTLKSIDQNCFQMAHSLVEVEVSPKNRFFKFVDDKYLLTKSDTSSENFDEIIFCRRDVQDVKIPKYVKKLSSNSFSKCTQLKTVFFEADSQLETIENYAFSWSSKVENIIVPSSVKVVGSSAFCNMDELTSVQFLGEDLTVEDCCFRQCNKLKSISFPNATKIFIDGPVSPETKIHVKADVQLGGDLVEDNSNCFVFEGKIQLNLESKTNEEEEKGEVKKSPEEEEENKDELKQIVIQKKKFDELVQHVRLIERNLSMFDDVEPYDFDSIINENIELNKQQSIKNNEEEEKEKENDKDKDDAVVEEEEEVKDDEKVVLEEEEKNDQNVVHKEDKNDDNKAGNENKEEEKK